MSDLRDAIATVIQYGITGSASRTRATADAVLALPEMQARERVIEAARLVNVDQSFWNLSALRDAMAALDALTTPDEVDETEETS